jgi:predicted Fe-Mo cluster-binding NifX family protein
MKIAVSASDPELDAAVNPRFGRTPFFLLVTPNTLEFEVVSNQENLQATHGAGIQAAALVARCRPAVVITGHCGPKAYQTLAAAGIPVVLGITGSVRDAVQQYLQGKLSPARAPDVAGHW